MVTEPTTKAEEIRSDGRGERGTTPIVVRARVLIGIACSAIILCCGTALLSLIACVTLFRARRIYSEWIVKWMARAGLFCCGIRVCVHRNEAADATSWERRQIVFISNHTSSLDMFVLIALGLPRTRYFLSGFLRRIVPLGIIGYILRVFWTPSQRFPERRRALFQRAERVLRQTGESVFLTPEGQQIGVFNKGAFHLATNLQAPIQPLFVEIPTEVDPGPWLANQDLDMRPGTVHVHCMPLIDTSDWKLADLEVNRDRVKLLYADWGKED